MSQTIAQLKARATEALAKPALPDDGSLLFRSDRQARECFAEILKAPDTLTDEETKSLAMHMAASVMAVGIKKAKRP